MPRSMRKGIRERRVCCVRIDDEDRSRVDTVLILFLIFCTRLSDLNNTAPVKK